MDRLRLINLTQHEVVIDPGQAPAVRIPPSGSFARLIERQQPCPALTVNGSSIPVIAVSYGTIADLPEPQPGVGYIVSRLTAAARPRSDVYFPLAEIRDETGRIVGCRALGQFVPEGGGADASGG